MTDPGSPPDDVRSAAAGRVPTPGPRDPATAALSAACKRALAEAELDYRPAAAISEGLLRDLARAAPRTRPAGLQAFDGVFRAMRTIQARFERSRPTLGIATGLTALDEALGGLHRGEVVLISGASASGRSALALHLAHAVASAKAPTVLRCFEEPTTTVMLRMLLGAAQAEDANTFTSEAWDRLVGATGDLSQTPLWVVDDGPATISSLGVFCDGLDARLRPEFALGLSLVVVDDVDAVRGGIHLALRTLKRLARKRNVAVVATAPRGVELRKLADEGPDVDLRVRRPDAHTVVVQGGRVDGGRELRAELVLTGGARWIHAEASNARCSPRVADPDDD
jgi:hypothetical protein